MSYGFNSLALSSPRSWRHENEEDRNRNRHGRVPLPRPYRQEDISHANVPWRLFEERVRTGPYALSRFPLQPYSPVRILIFDSRGDQSVNPRLRQFIQDSPPRIRGDWHLHRELPEPEEPGLTQEEFDKAMKKLRKQLYNPTTVRRARRRGLFSNRGNSSNVIAEDISETRDCAICLETLVLNEEVLVTPCNHMFHHDCLIPWVKSRGQCPICRLMLCERRNPGSSNRGIITDRSSGVNGVRNANEEELAMELVYLIRAMEEAFNWINISH